MPYKILTPLYLLRLNNLINLLKLNDKKKTQDKINLHRRTYPLFMHDILFYFGFEDLIQGA